MVQERILHLCACFVGVLTLEEFRHVYDVSQNQDQQQRRKLRGQFKQRSKYTWLYQGQGSHHVLRTLRNR